MGPPEKPSHFRLMSFALHAARGLVRDQSTRRWTMFVVVIAAMVLLFGGTTFFESFLTPREHPGWFIVYWIACGWLTFTALLLAVFDLLMLRWRGRTERKILRNSLKRE